MNGRQARKLLKSMSVMRLEPGDILVLRVRERLSPEATGVLRAQLQETLGRFGDDGRRIVVLDGGADLAAVRFVSDEPMRLEFRGHDGTLHSVLDRSGPVDVLSHFTTAVHGAKPGAIRPPGGEG